MNTVLTHRIAMIVLGCSALGASANIAIAQSDPAAAVPAGREALQKSGGFWGYPWYDSAADEVEAVAVRPKADTDWLGDFLQKWFGWLRNWNLGELLSTLGWILLAVVLGVVAYLIIRAYMEREVAAGRRASTTAAAAQAATIERVEALPAPIRDPHADFLAEARRHYQQGNFAEAIVYLFSYQLIELDKHNLLRLAKGKTNRQYVREVGRNQRSAAVRPLAGLLQQTMLLFEESFFGGRPPGPLAFESCWSELDEFQGQLAHQQGATP